MMLTSAQDTLDASAMHNASASHLKDEFRALRLACGFCSLDGRARIALAGSDRTRWLNGMITNNVRDLPVERGVYGFLLNPQGHILGDLYAYNRGDSLLVDTDRTQLEMILATFDHYIIMDDVEVANETDKVATVIVAGPKAREVLSAAGLGVPDLPMLGFKNQEWQGSATTLVCGDNPAVPVYEIWIAPAVLESLANALQAAGAARVSAEALDLLRIASGVPLYGKDIRERDLPQETSQERALHFSKGCYIGQEIVERIRSRGNVHRRFTGFQLDAPLSSLVKLALDGKDVGEITSVATLPMDEGDQNLALGYIRREIPAGSMVSGENTRATVADLPFKSIFGS